MNTSKKIDTHTIIVGSGISTDFFLKGVNKNKLKNFVVLTGNCENKEKIVYDKKEISITRASEFGGLSKKWLGTSKIFQNEKYINSSVITRESSKLQKYLLKNKSYLKRGENFNSLPLNISDLKKINSKKFNIYNSLNLKDGKGKKLQAKKHKNVKYIDYRIKKFYKIKDKIVCECYNNRNKIIIESKYLILASGTIDTSIQLLKFLNISKIKFRHQPYCRGFFMKKNKLKKFRNFNFPILNFEYYKGINMSGSIGAFSKRIEEIFRGKIIDSDFVFKISKKILYNKIVFFNFFLNSKINEFSIEKKNDYFLLKSKKNFNYIKLILKKKTQDFFDFLNKNLNNKIFYSRVFVPKIGEDKHYFGIKIKTNKKLKVNSKCQLNFSKNIFIIDQSVMDFDSSLFITFLSICNSYRIGKIFNKFL